MQKTKRSFFFLFPGVKAWDFFVSNSFNPEHTSHPNSQCCIFLLHLLCMNDKKKAFADLIISGMIPSEAISQVYQGISKKTAQNKASLFGKCPEVLAYIEQNSGMIREKVNNFESDILDNHIKKTVEHKAGKILTAIRKHQLLNEIAEGKIWNEKIVIVDGKIKRIKVKPNLNERLKAIEIANRMAGDLVKPKEPSVAKAEEVKKVIIMDDQSENIKPIQE